MPPPAEHNERLRHSNVLTEEAVRLTESCMLLYDIYEEIAARLTNTLCHLKTNTMQQWEMLPLLHLMESMGFLNTSCLVTLRIIKTAKSYSSMCRP